jgi:fructokinase
MKQEPGFLVCGEALIDVLRPAATPAGVTPDERIGGSPFNVALGLARMVQPVAFMGCISRDAHGDRLFTALTNEGVDSSAVQRTDAPTTLSVVGVGRDGTPAYAFHGANSADRQLTTQAFDFVPPKVRALHVGSYAMVVEPIASTLRALVDRVHRATLVAWDPNVRLTVVPDPERWRDLLDWMLPRTHVLKLSDEDREVLAPGMSPETFAEQALSRGVRLIVVTHGARGASAWTSAVHVSAPAESVAVADTVAAGDAFQAALLTWLAEHGRLLPDAVASLNRVDALAALTFATRAAALTCARPGAMLPRRDELR